jgi:heme-degrading monooxygenase HmoA
MYVLLVILRYIPEKREGLAELLEQGPEALRTNKGFKSGIYFSDDEKHEFGAMTIWETKEDCDAYEKSSSITSEVAKKLAPIISGTVFQRRSFYVDNFF